MRIFSLLRPRRVRWSGFLCMLLIFAAGCDRAVAPEEAFAYADRDFSATVSGCITRLVPDTYTGDPALVGERVTGVARPFSAVVSVRFDTAGGRTESVTYLDPPALSDITVTRRTDAAGAVSVSLSRPVAGGSPLTVELSAVASAWTDTLLLPLGILLPTGDLQAVSPTEDGSFTITRTDGACACDFTFVEGKALPLRVVWKTPAQSGEMTVRE